MKQIDEVNLVDLNQYVCTWEYENKLFAITFYNDENTHFVTDEDGDFVEDDCKLNFCDECSNIQFWEK